MIALLPFMFTLSATSAVAGPAQDPQVIVLDGGCTYPPELGPQKPNELRVGCDGLVISKGRGDRGLLIQFAEKQGVAITGFAGTMSNGVMTVERVYLAPALATPAIRGHCKLFFSGDDIVGASCVADVGGKTYVANFRAFAP